MINADIFLAIYSAPGSYQDIQFCRKIFSCKKKNKFCRQGGYLAYKTYCTRRKDV